jgi:hypothetical protein
VFLPVVHIGSTTFVTKVATRIGSLHTDGNGRNVDGRHVAATFDAEKLVRRIPFHFSSFRANAQTTQHDWRSIIVCLITRPRQNQRNNQPDPHKLITRPRQSQRNNQSDLRNNNGIDKRGEESGRVSEESNKES